MSSTMDRVTEKVKEASGNMSGEVESLKSSFGQLRHDVMDLLGHAFGIGREGAGAAKEGAAEAVDALKSRLTDLKTRGADGVSAVERKIEENPLPAALIAFGVGYVIAKIMTRR